MALATEVILFGRADIPPDENLSANYAATSFAEVTKTWKIKAYLTLPGTNVLVDLPSVTLSEPLGDAARARDSSRPPRPEIVEIIERTVTEHGDVWSELARG